MAEIHIKVTAADGHESRAITTRQKLRRELKAVRLTACVVGAVIILWTPYLIGGLILISGTSPLVGRYVVEIGGALGAGNSSINWIIYGLASQDFRQSALRIFSCHKPVLRQIADCHFASPTSRDTPAS